MKKVWFSAILCIFISEMVFASGSPLTAIPFSGPAPLSVQFTADTYISQHLWIFGDGSNGEFVDPLHTYTAAGSYDVTLLLLDGTICGPITVTVTEPSPEWAVYGLDAEGTAGSLALDANGNATIEASDVDGGSSDPDGDDLVFEIIGTPVAADVPDSVNLSVTELPPARRGYCF